MVASSSFIVEDNASQPQVAVRATEKLVNSDEVFAILNPFGSGTNAAVRQARDRCRRDLFLALGRLGGAPRIAGNSPLLFTTIANYDATTAAGLKWMIDQYKPQKVGFIFQEGPFGDLLRRRRQSGDGRQEDDARRDGRL